MFKKILCLLLVFIMLNSVAGFAVNEGDIVLSVPCAYDTFVTKSDKTGLANEDKSIILASKAYGRVAVFKFDISKAVDTAYEGAVLSLTLRNADASLPVEVFTFDDEKETAYDAKKFVTSVNITQKGRFVMEFVVTKAVKEALENGKDKVCFSIKSEAPVVPFFSSEASGIANQPSLIFTSTVPYVEGQKDFQYPKLTEKQLETHLATTIAQGHPYLFGRKADFDRVREYVFGKNEVMTAQYQTTVDYASKYIGTEPVPITVNLASGSYLGRGFDGWKIVMNCAFVYLMSGDEQYAQRAYKEAEYFADMSTWGTYQYIDNSQAAFAVALCYDWLYDWLNDAQREKLSSALRTKHLDIILDLHNNRSAAKYNASFYTAFFGNDNFAVLTNTSMFVQAIAVAETDVKASAQLMEKALKNLEKCFDTMYPDGVWYEGVNYWGYVGPFIARMLASMESAFGTTFGYEDIACIVNTSNFPIYAGSSKGIVIYSDSTRGSRSLTDGEIFYFGKLNGDVALQKFALDNCSIKAQPLICMWYDPDVDYSAVNLKLENDKHFRNLDMVVMKNTNEGKQETFGAFVVARPNKAHGFMSSGTVAFHALGKEWITAPGKDDYSLPGYWESSDTGRRWRYYFSRAEANNCLVINPSELGGQNAKSTATINTFMPSEDSAYAVSDLTDAYKGQVSSYTRGVMLDKNRTRFTVQDEVVLTSPSEVYSFFNFYDAEISISDDMKSATISNGNRKLNVEIDCDVPYELTSMAAIALPTSNLLPGGMRVSNMKKLAIHLNNVAKFNLRICITPYLFDEELENMQNTDMTPISEWKNENIEASVPLLTDLKFDGVTPASFSPYNRWYHFDDEALYPKSVTALADKTKYDVTVDKNSEENYYKIIVTDKKDSTNINTYIVDCYDSVKKANIIDVSGMKEVELVSATATTDDGNVPANAIDSDITTRWSASGEQSLTIELEKETAINCIAIALYSGNTRQAFFDIQVSDNGTKWTTVNSFESTGVTEDFEYFDLKDVKAKYVRYVGYGASNSKWNSVSEVKMYTK